MRSYSAPIRAISHTTAICKTKVVLSKKRGKTLESANSVRGKAGVLLLRSQYSAVLLYFCLRPYVDRYICIIKNANAGVHGINLNRVSQKDSQCLSFSKPLYSTGRRKSYRIRNPALQRQLWTEVPFHWHWTRCRCCLG